MSERLYGYGKNRTDFWGLAERLKKRQEWHMGNMRAEFAIPVSYYGQLPVEWHTYMRDADYIVYSYQTPIAWHDTLTGQWIQPDVKYSRTTTQHQHTVATAISVIDKV